MALTEPDFIERDADKITAEMIAKYEADTGKTLYPAQAERLLIDLWAYREMLVRVAVQEEQSASLYRLACRPGHSACGARIRRCHPALGAPLPAYVS